MLSGCLRKESLESSVSKWSVHKGPIGGHEEDCRSHKVIKIENLAWGQVGGGGWDQAWPLMWQNEALKFIALARPC